MDNGQCVLILLLAGQSQRFNSGLLLEDETTSLPKQFYPLAKKEGVLIFEASAQSLIGALSLDQVLFVFPEHMLNGDKVSSVCQNLFDEGLYRLQSAYPHCKIMSTKGGHTRHHSFEISINFLQEKDFDPNSVLIVHDANRPFLQTPYLKRIKKEIKKIGPETPCSVPVIQHTDSLILKNKNLLRYLPREKVYQIQTPQLLYLVAVYEAFAKKKMLPPCGQTKVHL